MCNKAINMKTVITTVLLSSNNCHLNGFVTMLAAFPAVLLDGKTDSQIRVHCELCRLSSHFGLQVIGARIKDLRHHSSNGAALAAERAANQLAGGVVVE